VQIDTSSHGSRGAVAVGVFSSAWGGSLTFIGLFISLRIVQDIDLVDRDIIWVFVFVCEYLYVGLKTSRRQIVRILAMRYTRVNRFHHRRHPSRSVGRSVCTPCKQSVQDRYVTAIATVSCSSRHASLGTCRHTCTWLFIVRFRVSLLVPALVSEQLHDSANCGVKRTAQLIITN